MATAVLPRPMLLPLRRASVCVQGLDTSVLPRKQGEHSIADLLELAVSLGIHIDPQLLQQLVQQAVAPAAAAEVAAQQPAVLASSLGVGASGSTALPPCIMPQLLPQPQQHMLRQPGPAQPWPDAASLAAASLMDGGVPPAAPAPEPVMPLAAALLCAAFVNATSGSNTMASQW